MKYLIMVLILAGCSTTVPVISKFPESPKYSLQSCPQLQTLKDGSKLSEVATTVTINYSTYYDCAVKNDAWIEWYKIQKHIYESVK